MSIFITLIAALIVFSAVIAIHEFGHFTVAKLCGIQVNEFSIGMGPALWKKIYKGTQYSLRALPVGGYVALEGEESPRASSRSGPRRTGSRGRKPCPAGAAHRHPFERGTGMAACACDGAGAS